MASSTTRDNAKFTDFIFFFRAASSEVKIENYTLGRGGFGAVFVATDHTEKRFAVKRFAVKRTTPEHRLPSPPTRRSWRRPIPARTRIGSRALR